MTPVNETGRCVRQRPVWSILRYSSSLAVFVSLTVCGPQYVLVHIGAHLSPLLTACFLIESEMDSAVDTRVADVVGDLLEGLILQGHARNRRVAQRDGMLARPIESLEYFASRIT